jgi:GH25 family lysozyme M1 (1,4-beta-N-acetylmuramidase)
MILGIDDWAGNTITDYKPATDAGVKFAYNRLGQGNKWNNTGEKDGKGDWAYKSHCENTRRAGWSNGTYWVLDPWSTYQEQLEWVITNWPNIDDLPFSVDIEVAGDFSNQKLIKLAGNFLGAFEAHYKVKPIIYTGAWFWWNHMDPEPAWERGYDFWLAGYPFTKAPVTCTWEELKSKWIPSLIHWPALRGRQGAIWQFSGDKFNLPGIKGSIDLNMVTDVVFKKLTGGKKPGVGAQTLPAGGRTGTVTATKLNIRSGPGLTFTVIGLKSLGDRVEILEENKDWIRIGEGQWVSKNWININ